MTDFNPEIIIFDIDETVVKLSDASTRGVTYPIDAIIDVFAAESALDRDVAAERIKVWADDFTWWDYPDFIDQFKLPAAIVYERLRQWHEAQLDIHDDTVELIKELHKRGVPLAVASNNPVTGCLMKLQRVGLADRFGSTFFGRIFGTNNLRGLKFSVEFWQRLVAHLDCPPDKILMIGDNPREDREIPAEAGIVHSIIIDRAAHERINHDPKGVIVNDARAIAELII
jgi:FMN phosphatase YigB (HAD superfamily)